MSDNIRVFGSQKSGSVSVATDEIGGTHYPIYKMSFGVDGAVTQVSASDPLPVELPDDPLPVRLGFGELNNDAWGHPKFTQPVSLFHGMWTFDIPASMWLIYEDGAEVANASSTGCTSVSGAANLDTTGGLTSVEMSSRRHPRYQPNRGHLFSTALICPDATADGVRDWGLFTPDNGVFFRLKADGKLYAVIRSGGSETHEEEIDTSSVAGYDVTKGHVYDIQFQWRGVGNYKFYIDLVLVHTFSFLGTLTELSVQNPALSAGFLCTKTTEDVSMVVGCADITSEGGSVDRLQYFSAEHERSTGTTNQIPLISIMSPATIGGEHNTRDLRLVRVSGGAGAKVTFRLYTTRDATALTGASFGAVSGTQTLVDTTATAITTAKCTLVMTFRVPANGMESISNPDPDRIDFVIVHGGYLILTVDGANTNVDGTIEIGEEI